MERVELPLVSSLPLPSAFPQPLAFPHSRNKKKKVLAIACLERTRFRESLEERKRKKIFFRQVTARGATTHSSVSSQEQK